MTTPDPIQRDLLAASSVREPLARFAWWVVNELRLDAILTKDTCQVEIPEDAQSEFDNREVIVFSIDGEACNGQDAENDGCGQVDGEMSTTTTKGCEEAAIDLTSDDSFFEWICRELREQKRWVHGRPRTDMRSVYELSERLFRQYQVDGGRVHLSGCTLDDRPFLRLTYAARDQRREVLHLFFTPDGKPVDLETRLSLELADVCSATDWPPHAAGSHVELLIAAGTRAIQNQREAIEQIGIRESSEPLACTVVWVKRAIGRLQFTIGEESIHLGFDEWAQTLEAPPFICPHTDVKSFHIAATDAGQIAAAESIETCAKSQARVLKTELVTCSVTEQRVLPEFTHNCPVTGRPTLNEAFGECGQCHQQVSRSVLRSGICEGCRGMAPIPNDDPRLVWLLTEYPRLEQWKRWRLSETASLYLVTGSRLWGHALFVFDKDVLAPRYAATRSRFRKRWYPLDPTEQLELFGERAMEKPPT